MDCFLCMPELTTSFNEGRFCIGFNEALSNMRRVSGSRGVIELSMTNSSLCLTRKLEVRA